MAWNMSCPVQSDSVNQSRLSGKQTTDTAHLVRGICDVFKAKSRLLEALGSGTVQVDRRQRRFISTHVRRLLNNNIGTTATSYHIFRVPVRVCDRQAKYALTGVISVTGAGSNPGRVQN